MTNGFKVAYRPCVYYTLRLQAQSVRFSSVYCWDWHLEVDHSAPSQGAMGRVAFADSEMLIAKLLIESSRLEVLLCSAVRIKCRNVLNLTSMEDD